MVQSIGVPLTYSASGVKEFQKSLDLLEHTKRLTIGSMLPVTVIRNFLLSYVLESFGDSEGLWDECVLGAAEKHLLYTLEHPIVYCVIKVRNGEWFCVVHRGDKVQRVVLSECTT